MERLTLILSTGCGTGIVSDPISYIGPSLSDSRIMSQGPGSLQKIKFAFSPASVWDMGCHIYSLQWLRGNIMLSFGMVVGLKRAGSCFKDLVLTQKNPHFFSE